MFNEFLLKNWYDLLQSASIVIGFALTYITFRSEKRSKKFEHLLSLYQSYQDIWSKTYTQPELLRIKKRTIDLEKHPITSAEERIVKEMMLHIYLVYQALEAKQLDNDMIEKDILEYLRLPIPNAIWQQVKDYYPKRFVNYISDLLN